MALNGIGGSFYQNDVIGKKKTATGQTQGFGTDFQDSILKSQSSKETVNQDTYRENTDVSKGLIYSKFDTGFGIIDEPVDTNLSDAVSVCQGKSLTFKDSDSVSVSVLQGYVLKAAVSDDPDIVYVEQKNEDGTVRTYEVDLSKVSEDTDNPIEQIALECASSQGQLSVDEQWQKAMEDFSAFVEDRIKNGPPKIMIGALELSVDEWNKLINGVDKEIEAIQEEQKERIDKAKEKEEKEEKIQKNENNTNQSRTTPFDKFMNKGTTQYSYLADESGVIQYNGVTIMCDKNAITIGNMSKEEDIITIPLSAGGVLKVNRNNKDDLAKAIGMFSPEDVKIIMAALAADNKIQEMEQEIDDDENSIGDSDTKVFQG